LNLDERGIAVSGGSACSGSGISHVIKAIQEDIEEKVTLRFSFSKQNTLSEVNHLIDLIKQLV